MGAESNAKFPRSFCQVVVASLVAAFNLITYNSQPSYDSLLKMRANEQDSWRPAPVPATNSLAKVAAAAKECTACPLYKKATQTRSEERRVGKECRSRRATDP